MYDGSVYYITSEVPIAKDSSGHIVFILSSSLSLSLVWLVVHLWLLVTCSGGYVGGPCPLGDSWLYDREDNEWTRLEVCSSPVNDGAMIRVGHPILHTTCCV